MRNVRENSAELDQQAYEWLLAEVDKVFTQSDNEMLEAPQTKGEFWTFLLGWCRFWQRGFEGV